jgi:hypothetical protein
VRDILQKSFQTGDNEIIKCLFRIYISLRDSDSFVPNAANYGDPQNGNVGLEEQILNVVDRRPREKCLQCGSTDLSYGESFTVNISIPNTCSGYNIWNRMINPLRWCNVSGFFGSTSMTLHLIPDC